MSIFKICKCSLLYSFQETFILIKKHILATSIYPFLIPLFGWSLAWYFEGGKELMNLLKAFWYLNFLPSILCIVGLFCIKLIRSDLELKLKAKNNNITNAANDYSYYIGSLLELLKEYDYQSEYQNRHFFNDIHNSYTYSYNELNTLRIKIFDDPELAESLKEFLSYFKYWWSGLLNIGAYNIKPNFNDKNSFLENEEKIKTVATEINKSLKLRFTK